MKCVNCGAEVIGDKCEYCGTHYNGHRITATFGCDDHFGMLQIGGSQYKVYISRVDIESVAEQPGRDINGRLMPPKVTRKRIFTLVEY